MTENWPIIILCAVGISLLLTMIIIPQILHVSLEKRLFDRPNSRKVHKGNVPRLGGFAFFPVIFVTLGLMLIIPAAYSNESLTLVNREFISALPDAIVLFAAMIIIFMTGLYDDLLGMKYWVKFLVQILTAILIVEAGEYIVNYDTLFGITLTTPALGKIISGFLIVYIINALNLIDGIDGLASGLCVVTLCFFGFVLYYSGRYIFSMLCWVSAASMFVFWLFNVCGSYRKHTKIFMGDIGTLSMGLLISFMCIAIARQPQSMTLWGLKPMVVAFSPLILPMFDVLRVFCYRICRKKSPFLPDKSHIHHLMLSVGLKMRTTMSLLILLQVLIVVLNIWIAFRMNINGILGIDLGIYLAVILAIKMMGKEKA